MADFVFNLDQLKSSATTIGSGINTNLYSKTKDEDLKYTGNDYIIWDRTNAERIRRGLPSLPDTGYARPPEDTTSVPATGSAPTNPDGTAKTFAIKGPPGLTRDQAFAIFKKQADTGGLTGFEPGETLSAATQAADGLPSAQAIVAQAQSGITGSTGAFASSLSASGVDLATGRIPSLDTAFSKGGINGGATGLGAVVGSVASGLGAAGGAVGGSLAGIAPGLTAAVGPAVSSFSGVVGGVGSISGIGQMGSPLVGAASIQGSTAIKSIQTINQAITGLPVTNPINTADFSKIAGGLTSVGAVAPIGPMSIPEVNGVLAQAKNLTGQGFGDISNSKGLGAFGLDVSQLETAGYVKPGSRAKFDASSFTNLIKSPAIWTGKDGIKSATDLLANAPKQSQIQQDLMIKGVAGMAAIGIPVQNLSSQGIAGMTLNAAKSLPNAEAFAKGLPIPGDATGAVQAEFSSAVRDGAFAVNLVNTKIPTAFKQQDIPKPAADTVGRATVDAASSRVIGDDKVPTPNYVAPANSATVSNYEAKANTYVNNWLLPLVEKLQALDPKFAALENQQTITQQQYDALNAERDAVRNNYNINGIPLLAEIGNLYNSLSNTDKKTISDGTLSYATLKDKNNQLAVLSRQQKERLYTLSQKIEGRGEGE